VNDKINISLTDNTRLVKQSSTHNNVNINSYVIANRTHSNQIGTNDLTSKDNNDALIHSELINTNNMEFVHDNIFSGVEKMTITSTAKKNESPGKYNNMVNDIMLSENNDKFTYSRRKYNEEIDDFKVEWKSLSKPKFYDKSIRNINQGIINNCSLIASIISIVNYDLKFSRNTFNSIIYPRKVLFINLEWYILCF
jgi:hypothetical protein